MREAIERSNEDLVRFLIKRCSLPPSYGEEVCQRAGLEKKIGPRDLSVEQFDSLFGSFRELILESLDEKDIYVHILNNAATLVEPALLTSFFGSMDPHRTRMRFSE